MPRHWWHDGADLSAARPQNTPPATPSRFSGRPDHRPAAPSRFSGRSGEMAEADMALPVPDDLHPTAGVRVRRRRRLHLIAAQHGGCFTIAHTREAGYDRRARHHHLGYGNWRRTDAPGVYRLTGWPIDPAEPYHAWLLWAGAGAELTSWSALDVSGVLDVLPGPLTVVTPGEEHPRAERPDPRAPVHLVRPGTTRRRRDRVPQADPALVRVHLPGDAALPSVVIDGLPSRSVEESLCIALKTSVGAVAVYAGRLTERLLDEGIVDLRTMLDTARHCRSTRMLDLLWPRIGRRRGDAV